MLLGRVLVGALLLSTGCTLFGGGEEEPCALAGMVDAEIVYAGQDGALAPVVTDTMVPLIAAPQGGFILLIGARLHTKTASCQVDINAALRDPVTNLVLGLEQRPMTISAHGEWSGPADPAGLSDVANVAVCPSQAAEGIAGRSLKLEVRVRGESGATVAEATSMVTPTCNDSSYCLSECGPPNL